MPTTSEQVAKDTSLVAALVARASSDLGAVLERRVELEPISVRRERAKVTDGGGVQISFRGAFTWPGGEGEGVLLVPLPAAIAMAGYLLMLGDDEVRERARSQTLDRSLKDAMLEVGIFLCGAMDAAMHEIHAQGSARSEGCQGVAAGAKPRFAFVEGQELLVAELRVRVHDQDPAIAILMLPAIDVAAARAA